MVLDDQRSPASPPHMVSGAKLRLWRPLAPVKGASPRGLPHHRTSRGSWLKDPQAKRLQFPSHWHFQLTVIYWIPSKEQTRGLSWWRSSWVVNVCHLPGREDKSVTGTSGEAERETGRDSEMQRCRKGNREGSALVIVWDPQKGKQGRLSSRDCVGPAERETGKAQLSWLCGTQRSCCGCQACVWICCSFTLSSLCSLEAWLRTRPLCQVASVASLLLSLAPSESLAQRRTCFSVSKEMLGMSAFFIP